MPAGGKRAAAVLHLRLDPWCLAQFHEVLTDEWQAAHPGSHASPSNEGVPVKSSGGWNPWSRAVGLGGEIPPPSPSPQAKGRDMVLAAAADLQPLMPRSPALASAVILPSPAARRQRVSALVAAASPLAGEATAGCAAAADLWPSPSPASHQGNHVGIPSPASRQGRMVGTPSPASRQGRLLGTPSPTSRQSRPGSEWGAGLTASRFFPGGRSSVVQKTYSGRVSSPSRSSFVPPGSGLARRGSGVEGRRSPLAAAASEALLQRSPQQTPLAQQVRRQRTLSAKGGRGFDASEARPWSGANTLRLNEDFLRVENALKARLKARR
mmetsp:Transcript_74007/g.166130  ORF Transcript_74007/g.166130 Transcript_74007/m.166130 type:complete len:324 (-) Transcript_74007:39-1010(-)